MHSFEAYIFDRIAAEIATWPQPQSGIDVADAYVLTMCIDSSLETLCFEHACLYFSYNTESYWRAAKDRASSPGEARWTRPFWPDDDRVVIPGVGYSGEFPLNPDAVALRDAWLSELGLEVTETSDEEWHAFAALCARAGRRLHDEGIIMAVFGRPIVIRITDLEGSGAIDQLTFLANPPGVADEYAAWCASSLATGLVWAVNEGWAH